MRKILPLLCALGFCLEIDTYAQNEIDHVNSYYWSGYGKMAIDHDTLYLNSMNGAGVERYYIADPANPRFIDRTHVSGFDQIDFERRLMADYKDNRIVLSDFSEFDNTIVVSYIDIPLGGQHRNWSEWKLAGDYLLIGMDNDSLLTYNITDPAFPSLSAGLDVNRHSLQPFSYTIAFGSTVCAVRYKIGLHLMYEMRDIYDIRTPTNIQYLRSDSMDIPQTGGVNFEAACGDTFADAYASFMGIQWYIQFVSLAENDTSHLPGWSGYGESEWPPAGFNSMQNGFMLYYRNVSRSVAYSYDNFSVLGYTRFQFPYEVYDIFETTPSNYLLGYDNDNLRIFQPTYSDTIIMPQVNVIAPSHFGILSSCAYGSYVLSGAESNGGELLVHELGQDGQLSLAATLPGMGARQIVVDGATAFCLTSNTIYAIDLTNPHAPQVRHQYWLDGDLNYLAVRDSIVIIGGPTRYSILDYDAVTGFTILYQPSEPTPPYHSLVRDALYFYVLVDADAYELAVFDISDPLAPNLVHNMYSMHEFQNLEIIHNRLWASGPHGTVIYNTSGDFDSAGFFGPEYFSDVHNMNASGETLYVADGENGLRVFTFQGDPANGLRFAGGYSTGNEVQQISIIGNNFFLSDYYSLHHLRWGAPTAVGSELGNSLPDEISLSQNYPNPFNAQTTIEFALLRASGVHLEAFDILGRKVASLFEGFQTAGRHRVVWDAGGLSSGIYFYRLHGNGSSEIKRCMLMK
jgi:hypothetical protein